MNRDPPRLRQHGTGHVLHDAGDAGFAALGLVQADLDDDELVRAGGGLVVDVQVRRHADLLWEVQESLWNQVWSGPFGWHVAPSR